MTAQTCESCRFCAGYFAPSYARFQDDSLRCRRFPPQFSGGQWGGIFSSPNVSRTDWCGEWAAKPQQPEGRA